MTDHTPTGMTPSRWMLEQKLALHIQQTPIAYIEWDLNFEVVEWSPAAERLFGYRKDEALGRHAADLIIPVDGKPVIDQLWHDLLQQTGLTHTAYDTNRAKDGRLISCEWRHTPLIDQTGQAVGVASFVQDVRDNQHREEDQRNDQALRESEELYRKAIEAAGAVPYYLDHHTDTFTFIGDGIRRLTGYAPDEFTHPLWDSLIEETRLVGAPAGASYEDVINLTLAGELPVWRCDYRIRTRHGEQRWIAISAIEVFDKPGVSRGAIGILQDITERNRAEAERMRLQDELIRLQAATIAEMSVPFIPITNDIMVMPLIGSIDSQRAQHVLETLLNGIASHHISVAILDITGVSIVDTQVADHLIRAAQAVRMLGAEVMLTGIRPEVAQTLVGLGVDLTNIITQSTLQHGIAYAIKHFTSTASSSLSAHV